MRLHAYMKSIDEAMKLPKNIQELKSYFKIDYSPLRITVHKILKMARKDDFLYDFEFVELYNYVINLEKNNANNIL